MLLGNYQELANECDACIGTVQKYLQNLQYEQQDTDEAKQNLAAALFALTALAGSYGFSLAELVDEKIEQTILENE